MISLSDSQLGDGGSVGGTTCGPVSLTLEWGEVRSLCVVRSRARDWKVGRSSTGISRTGVDYRVYVVVGGGLESGFAAGLVGASE